MNWIGNNLATIWLHTLEHLSIAVPAVLLSFVLSIPLGWLAYRFRWSRGIILSVSSVLYAIPSLPLIIVLAAIVGAGLRSPVNIITALTIYGIALMVRSTVDGLVSVGDDLIQSATAVGYSAWSRFWRVELPLAGPVLLAGIRVVSVSTISLTTVGAVLGIPGLGLLFTDGFQRGIQAEIWSGIVLTVALALVFDVVIVLIGRVLMPWVRATRKPLGPRVLRVVAA